MHNKHVFPAGVVPDACVVTPGRLRKLDQQLSEAGNGIDGGTWAPKTRVILGGAPSSMSGTITGGIRTGRGSPGGLVLNDNDYPTFATPRTRTIFVPPFSMADVDEYLPLEGGDPETTGHISAVGLIVYPGLFTAWSIPARYLHNGATLAQARLKWRGGQRLDVAVGLTPGFNIIRVHRDGTMTYSPSNDVDLYTVPVWTSGATYAVGDVIRPTNGGGPGGTNQYKYRCVVAGTVPAGQPAWSTTTGANQVVGGATFRVERGPSDTAAAIKSQLVTLPHPLANNGGDLYDSGRVQTITLTPTQNDVIDTQLYSYLAVLQMGTGVRDVYFGLELDFTNIVDLRPMR